MLDGPLKPVRGRARKHVTIHELEAFINKKTKTKKQLHYKNV